MWLVVRMCRPQDYTRHLIRLLFCVSQKIFVCFMIKKLSIFRNENKCTFHSYRSFPEVILLTILFDLPGEINLSNLKTKIPLSYTTKRALVYCKICLFSDAFH